MGGRALVSDDEEEVKEEEDEREVGDVEAVDDEERGEVDEDDEEEDGKLVLFNILKFTLVHFTWFHTGF
uniref:Uncharacterized protein n=1 Tax=Nelumbo nucifera TaxID=4432 RepID=A0A822XTC4_NELNU|nr:TPA_asm: hypothetical protein HUJ06_023802 [Nelumbo nucifera]